MSKLIASAVRPVEYQVFTDGRVKLWGSHAAIFWLIRKNFPELAKTSEYHFYPTGTAVVLSLTPKQIAHLITLPGLEVTDWARGLKTTQLVLEQAWDKNANPVSQKVFYKRVDKLMAQPAIPA